MISRIHYKTWRAIGEGITPWHSSTDSYRFFHYLKAPLLISFGVITLTAHTAARLITGLNWWLIGDRRDPRLDFSAVTQDARNWSKLDPSDVTFDPNFLFGAATCTFQDSGAVSCPNSQWKSWEERRVPADNRSGESAHLFELYKTLSGRRQIIDRLKKLNYNSYRFNIEWAHIEPRQGQYDKRALAVYIDFCKALRSAGIEPLVTLHHFSEPKWFHDLGSFEKEENIQHFINFCKFVYPVLTQNYWFRPLVNKICTINEPGIEAFSRYVRGAFSPGYFMRFSRAGEFLKGMLKAHCAAYEVMKEIRSDIQIGVIHQALRMEASNGLLEPVVHIINRLTHYSILNFFKTGIFDYQIPLSSHIHDETMSPKTDFVGLQYYTRPVIGFTGSTSYGEPMTQMPFREDPAGLYEMVLETFDAFHKPVIVTENGISTHDAEQRKRYNERALYTLKRAADTIGHENVRGYYTWSFCDNSEWDMGRHPQAFGAYALQDDGSLALEPKAGMEPVIEAATRSAAAKEKVA